MKSITNIIMTIMIISSVINLSEAQVKFTKKIGGDNGTSFMLPSSRQAILSTDRITGIAIQHGRRIEQIELEYSIGEGFNIVEHIGNDAGEWSYIDLEPGEFITYITGQAGTLIDQITFHTSLRRTFGPYGGSGGQYFELTVPPNAMIIGFTGKAGPSIKQLGLIYKLYNKRTGEITKRSERGTRYEGKSVSDIAKSSSRRVRDHRTGKGSSNESQDSIGVMYADPMKALAAANHLNAQAEADRLNGMADEMEEEPTPKKKVSTSKRINVRDHRTEDNQDSIGVVYANGIGALIQVTQLKSQFANEEALQGADKQKEEVDKKDKKPKQNNKK